ncbi:MAG TPA: hypothetical protein VE954_32710 [Oligoflexus sp.]|uniref:hypothetical protein n=1 Tax=Oligoflexus sp. TaxID=1971216 RepID=UPI002D2855E3|nr:hypothetical protein [Oligoflexus sp.]HYX37891.1 hypothetical protein [Oligoflexus sp.]
MGYASTTQEERHRKSPARQEKNRAERERYWESKGLTPEAAKLRAAMPSRRRLRSLPNSQPELHQVPARAADVAANLESANLESANLESANLESRKFQAWKNKYVTDVPQPSRDEVQKMVHQLQLSTPISSRSSSGAEIHAVAREDIFRPTVQVVHENKDNSFKFERWPFIGIAFACSAWLTTSLWDTLGGTLGTLIVAAAFEYAPPLLIGAKTSDPRSRQIAVYGAVAIFLTSILLFIAPHVQLFSNEFKQYRSAQSQYDLDMAAYQLESSAAAKLLSAAEFRYQRSSVDYQKNRRDLGDSAPETLRSKRQLDKDFATWKVQSQTKAAPQRPSAPVLSDELRKASQDIAQRIGLQAIACLMMFVLRRLDDKAR